jgi:signal transduction histidine kinase
LIMGSETRQQVFEASCQPVMHANGWIMGYVFVLHDITSAWSSRQQLAQQQWTEATRQERQQLAEDLHDGLSQKLAFINLQSQAAQVFLKTGQSEEAQTCLSRLVDETRQMQGNMRESIGDLMVDNLTFVGFMSALRQILTSFENQTGQRAVLILDADTEGCWDSDILEPMVTVQLLRIIQEALANVRQHAQNVREVEVKLARNERQMQVTIIDDGSGFDMSAVRLSDSKHFGLYIMQKRATRIGAQFFLHSQINLGTVVEIKIPLVTVGMRSAA